jgi:hypothetical protein
VAVIHGDRRAGQFAKRKALTHTHRILAICMAMAAIVGAVFGTLIGTKLVADFTWTRRALELPMGVLLLLMSIAFLACLGMIRLIDKPLDSLVRERLKWLRGGQAEGLVAWYLNEFSEKWHVFHNIQLQDGSDIDHVLVGPPGIF